MRPSGARGRRESQVTRDVRVRSRHPAPPPRAARKAYEPAASSSFEAQASRSRAGSPVRRSTCSRSSSGSSTAAVSSSLEEYLETARPGRGVPFPARLRTAVWELYQAFAATRSGERFPELRNEAVEDRSQQRLERAVGLRLRRRGAGPQPVGAGSHGRGVCQRRRAVLRRRLQAVALLAELPLGVGSPASPVPRPHGVH